MSDDPLTIFPSLQQAVLDCPDGQSLVQTLLNKTIAQQSFAQLDYTFVAAIFFTDDHVQTKYFVANGHDTTLADQPLTLNDILSDKNYIKADILANRLVMTTKVDLLAPAYQSQQTTSIIISPIQLLGKIVGVFILGSRHDAQSISAREKDFIEMLTNFLASMYRLEDTQASLTNISQEVYKMNAKLHQLDKLKDDFVSVASHELRTPMTAIKSYLWMALNKHKTDLPEDLKRYLDRAYEATDRLINLVNDMLNVSRIEGGRIALKLAPTDLVALAKDVAEEILPRATERKLHLIIQEVSMPQVLCDKDKIREIYLNLIGNSVKFTPEQGSITVSFAQKDQFVYITVADTGRGISQEDISRLFAKFGRLDNSYVSMAESGGTGLGLYISKSLIALHKGTIEAKSEGLNKGAQFIFSLPIVDTDVAKQLEHDAPKEQKDTKDLEKTNVLL